MTFSNIESSKTPQESENNEVQEHAESPEVQEEAQQLEQATFEPEAVIELERTHEEAEAVESAFVETMRGAESSAGEGGRPGSGVEATPINLPNPVEDAAVLPIPVPSPESETSGQAVIIDSNDGPGMTDDPEMIANAPASDFSADAEVDLSNVANLPRSAKTMQIISNILKNEQDANNHILENRRGADAETGGEEPQEDGVNLTSDDVKTSIGTWPESDASPEMQMESIEDHLASGSGDSLSPDGVYRFVGNGNTSAQDIADHVTSKSDSASLPEEKSEGLGEMSEMPDDIYGKETLPVSMGDTGGMPGGAGNSGYSGGPTLSGMSDLPGGSAAIWAVWADIPDGG